MPLPLQCALHFIRTQAAGAGVDVAGRTVYDCLNALYVGFPSAVGPTVGVGNLNPERNAFSADIAFCHCLHLLYNGIKIGLFRG